MHWEPKLVLKFPRNWGGQGVKELVDTLNGCLCRSVLNSSLSGVIKCKQAGCETQWYHLQCVGLEQEP
ncbi:hypothetical protein L208DRAFT_1232778 [Tricholoma matsutake]|nr:hypothetical protein L208DRAFT_1232778 [Tricholoma matsutake 945]